MSTILFVLIILAIMHYIIETVIIPTARIELQYKLFAIRDNLRMMKFKNKIKNETLYNIMDSLMCKSIKFLPFINLSILLHFLYDNKMNNIKENNSLDNIPEEFHFIINENMKVVYKAFVINSISWLIYLFPILLVYLIFRLITKWSIGIKKFLLQLILSKEPYPSYEAGNFATC
jgi:hypothetical protein